MIVNMVSLAGSRNVHPVGSLTAHFQSYSTSSLTASLLDIETRSVLDIYREKTKALYAH